jgi:hypothetical protein
MLETVCDGGALQAEALRLQAEAAQKATRRTALRWLRQVSLNRRQLALAALTACVGLVLSWRLVHSSTIPETAIAAETLPRPSPAPPTATDLPLVPPPELPPPTPELQRDALRAALNGDGRAPALYQRLTAGPDARTFQLAARLSSRGHIRKP